MERESRACGKRGVFIPDQHADFLTPVTCCRTYDRSITFENPVGRLTFRTAAVCSTPISDPPISMYSRAIRKLPHIIRTRGRALATKEFTHRRTPKIGVCRCWNPSDIHYTGIVEQIGIAIIKIWDALDPEPLAWRLSCPVLDVLTALPPYGAPRIERDVYPHRD